jgi:hypothetical protein
MNPRINILETSKPGNSHEFGRGFLFTVIVITIVALAAMMASDRMMDSEESTAYAYRHFSVFPWIVATGKTIANGLAEFSGKVPEMPSASLQVTALAGLLLTFVICPTVFLFRWREKRLSGNVLGRSRPLTISSLVYGFCQVITLFFAIGIIPFAVLQHSSQESMRTNHAIQSDKDRIINAISLIATSLRQYRILPKSEGGGQGSFRGFSLPVGFTQNRTAMFSVIASNDTASVEARSLGVPEASVSVRIIGGKDLDNGSRYFEWSYEGKFQ